MMYFIHITFVSFISDYLLLKALTVITENIWKFRHVCLLIDN